MRPNARFEAMRASGRLARRLALYHRARRIWLRLPLPRGVRALATSALYRLSGWARAVAELGHNLPNPREVSRRPAERIPAGELVLSGFLSDVSGIGRAGRMSALALQAAGFAPRLHDLRREPAGWAAAAPGGVWLAHCNAPEAADFLLRSDSARSCYRVGYWAWELPALPPQWGQIAALMHEIWAPSRFVAEAVRAAIAGLDVGLRVVPHPHPALDHVRPDRERFALPAGVFAFLSMFDVRSSVARKNPMGAVRAFQRAFSPKRGDVCLLVKVVSAEEGRSCLAELQAAASGWPNIRLMTDVLTDREVHELIASSDAFVSLHRSEGFGLPIAEAMALGRPVIVTAWSGNMDFCDAGAALVPYRLVPVEDPAGLYDFPGQQWAEPDLAAAAQIMRRLADDPEWASDLGAEGRSHLRSRLPSAYDLQHLQPWLAGAPPSSHAPETGPAGVEQNAKFGVAAGPERGKIGSDATRNRARRHRSLR